MSWYSIFIIDRKKTTTYTHAYIVTYSRLFWQRIKWNNIQLEGKCSCTISPLFSRFFFFLFSSVLSISIKYLDSSFRIYFVRHMNYDTIINRHLNVWNNYEDIAMPFITSLRKCVCVQIYTYVYTHLKLFASVKSKW